MTHTRGYGSPLLRDEFGPRHVANKRGTNRQDHRLNSCHVGLQGGVALVVKKGGQEATQQPPDQVHTCYVRYGVTGTLAVIRKRLRRQMPSSAVLDPAMQGGSRSVASFKLDNRGWLSEAQRITDCLV